MKIEQIVEKILFYSSEIELNKDNIYNKINKQKLNSLTRELSVASAKLS